MVQTQQPNTEIVVPTATQQAQCTKGRGMRGSVGPLLTWGSNALLAPLFDTTPPPRGWLHTRFGEGGGGGGDTVNKKTRGGTDPSRKEL